MHFEACDDGRPHPATFVDLPGPDDDGAGFEAFAGEAHTNGVAFADLGGAAEDEEAEPDGRLPAPAASDAAA